MTIRQNVDIALAQLEPRLNRAFNEVSDQDLKKAMFTATLSGVSAVEADLSEPWRNPLQVIASWVTPSDPAAPVEFKGFIPEMSKDFLKGTLPTNPGFLGLKGRIEAAGFVVDMAAIEHKHCDQVLSVPIKPKAVNTNTAAPASAEGRALAL